MAQESNLYMDQGTDFIKTISVIDDEGVGVDLEDYVVKSQMRKFYGSTSGYTFESGVFSYEDSIVYIAMNNEKTRDIPAGRYLYDVEIIAPSGERIRLVEGVITVTPEITKI